MGALTSSIGVFWRNSPFSFKILAMKKGLPLFFLFFLLCSCEFVDGEENFNEKIAYLESVPVDYIGTWKKPCKRETQGTDSSEDDIIYQYHVTIDGDNFSIEYISYDNRITDTCDAEWKEATFSLTGKINIQDKEYFDSFNNLPTHRADIEVKQIQLSVHGEDYLAALRYHNACGNDWVLNENFEITGCHYPDDLIFLDTGEIYLALLGTDEDGYFYISDPAPLIYPERKITEYPSQVLSEKLYPQTLYSAP